MRLNKYLRTLSVTTVRETITGIGAQILVELTNTKFHENLFGGSPTVLWIR
jgi:hypothetical protein